MAIGLRRRGGRGGSRPRRAGPQGRPRDPDRFEAWIHRILVHACYDESQRARHWTADVRLFSMAPSTPDGSAVIADRDELERAFRRLSIEQRAVFVLHHYLGLPSWRSRNS